MRLNAEARSALETLVTHSPGNAELAYTLGSVLRNVYRTTQTPTILPLLEHPEIHV